MKMTKNYNRKFDIKACTEWGQGDHACLRRGSEGGAAPHPFFLFFIVAAVVLFCVCVVGAEEQSAITLLHKSAESVAAGDLHAALGYADKAIGVDPAYHAAWKQHGRVLMLKGDYTAAIVSLEKALKLQSDDTTTEWLLNSLIALNRFGDVLERLKSAKKDILGTKRYVYIYNALLEGAKSDEVLRFSTYLESAQSTTIIGRVSAAITRVIKNDPAGAQTILSAIKAGDEDERTAIAIGWGYVGKKAFDTGDFKGAMEPFKQALVLYPKWSSALRQLGWAYRMSGEPLSAVKTWEHGLPQDESQVSWLGWMAEAYLEAGKNSEATAIIDRLIKLNPTHERGRILKVMLTLKTGNAAQKKALEANLKGATKDNLYVLNMGYSLYYMSEKLYDKAAVVLEVLYKMRPADKDIVKRLIEAYSGWIAALNKGSRDSAETSETMAAKKDDSNARILALMKKLIALDPERPGVWRDMGWALWVGGKRNEAIEAWQKALNLNIADRDTMILQVLSALAEAGDSKEALALYNKWQPGAGFLPFGIKLLEARRTLAAAPFLEAAFEKKEDPPVSGLYLANVNARRGICVSIYDSLDPFLKRGVDKATDEQNRTLLTTLDLCLFDINIASLFNVLDSQIGKDSSFFEDITRVMEKAAKQYNDSHNVDEALNLYRRVIKRSPTDPLTWVSASNAAATKSLMSEADSILDQALTHDLPPFIKQRVLGKREELKGNTTAAIDYYKKSIELEPAQPDLRTGLFKMLYAQDRFTEAREELQWVEGRIEAGETALRVYIADMYTVMGYTSKALDMWNMLAIAYPETPNFAIEKARLLFQTCKADKAIETLKGILETKPSESAFTLYVDILQNLGQNEKIMELTPEGIKNYPENEILLRSRAEAAESLMMTEEARQTAQGMLDINNSNPEMSRLAARSIVDAKLIKEGRAYYEALLERSPFFLPSLTALRNITSSQQDTSQAVKYGKMVVQQRPWDVASSIRYATSLAEDQDFADAYKIMRRHVSTDVTNAVPVLLYTNVTVCNYNGRSNVNQVIAHLQRLKAEGFEFITPDNVSWPSKTPRVIVVIANAEMDALKEIDTELQKLQGRAVYADNMDILLSKTEGTQQFDVIGGLVKSGRWLIASNGARNNAAIVINENGNTGNPSTHAAFKNGKKETPDEMATRLRKYMKDAERPVNDSKTKVLLYYKGDYGHLSLDTDSQQMDTLRNVTAEHFDMALSIDEDGFVFEGYDPLRLSCRSVPANWDGDRLIEHIKYDNPLVVARLEYAKALSQQLQFSKANKWFKEAEVAGAKPLEVNFHWASSAYYGGDLPLSDEKLQVVKQLDPDSERTQKIIKRNKNRRRLMADLRLSAMDDSANRYHSSIDLYGEKYVLDDLTLDARGQRLRWSRQGIGKEQGTRLNVHGLWHFGNERWLEGGLWYMKMEHLKDFNGGMINIHLPNPSLSGHVEAGFSREEVDTVEAIRKGIYNNYITLNTYSRLFDVWDLFANLGANLRSDSNKTYSLTGRVVRRLHEWPLLGVGYAFNLANSDSTPIEYWAPRQLQQHQLYAIYGGKQYGIHYVVSSRAGFAHDYKGLWRFVWDYKIQLDYDVDNRFKAFGEIRRLQTPDYQSDDYTIGVSYRF
ncbi:hypothetical protein MBAV_002570 [Candidatus Magnetobacterium bavaricum]|uniref:Tetratricopeptide repeat protein n=1 Tax=Candidatus Magnetobacterium bavaricum TaxID=29290 RepID=A0A0F3GX25_9BACT|nr:hypothetical protein MBAV_002570 [Candidatus Magnetobacterium bavaricum]